MSARAPARVFSIPPGARFLPVLVDSLLSGKLVEGFAFDGDPLALADATIFVPTRRAARELRSLFVSKLERRSTILPVIRPLGDFDEDAGLFEAEPEALLLAPPMTAMDRLLMLAPLVQAWRKRLPAHVAALFAEEVVVPASVADSIWLARDLAALMDEIETEGADWTRLGELVPEELAGWWQVTLEFLSIVTTQWPKALAEIDRSNPAAHRNALIEAEATRLARNPPTGPVIAAGSTGSIPATSKLLSVIARLPRGAVVLPGLDKRLDEEAWAMIGDADTSPSICGHPQFGLKKLLGVIGVERRDVEELAIPAPSLVARAALVSEALRPAETTDRWAAGRAAVADAVQAGALAGVTLAEAANERDEALAIAIALRKAVGEEGRTAALVTADRALARRVSAELLRFGIRADDSGGTPLADTPPAVLLRLLLEAVFTPGDPVAILALLKHPLLTLGMERAEVRAAAEVIELVALRGGVGRPDITGLSGEFERRLAELAGDKRKPDWLSRFRPAKFDAARRVLGQLEQALAPLAALRNNREVALDAAVRAAVRSLEEAGRGSAGDLAELYRGDAGEKLADFLRSLIGAQASLPFNPDEFPAVMTALIATETVKPRVQSDSRVAIWGVLEARLQTVDTLVVGGLNEGSWPRRAEADRFMSRMMKSGMSLEPPERRIGLAAHDFSMAMGTENIILTRSARTGDAPSVPSRWIQRLLTCAGEDAAKAMRVRGGMLVDWARTMDEGENVPFAERPRPAPPLEARPRHFSVTEIETLRRDPYAIYAKKILNLQSLEPLVRDPGAAERGSLFHDILHRFVTAGVDPLTGDAVAKLIEIGRGCFDEAALPADVRAVWWPRFVAMAGGIVEWERNDRIDVMERHAEARAEKTAVGGTGVTLSGYADRIDLRAAGYADIIDYKTGSSPSKAQAHTLLSPQLALEGALLRRGAFAGIGEREPAELAYVRLKASGKVIEETILEYNRQIRSPVDLSQDAWSRLEKLLDHYNDPANGYLSRALPFREGDTEGDYDHLARVLEWSAGADDAEAVEGGE
jgi:ATP-dependent helicase/nuclease subunit B